MKSGVSYLSSPICFLFLFSSNRFLRARQFDLLKAKEMLLDCEKWRKEFGVDDIIKYVSLFLSFFFQDEND